MAVTLINVFTVPAEREQEFLENWTRTAEHFSKRAGFIETHLHRNTGVGNQTFQFINIARWADSEAWKGNHDDYRPPEYDIPGLKGHPAIFESVTDIYADAVPADQRGAHWIARAKADD